MEALHNTLSSLPSLIHPLTPSSSASTRSPSFTPLSILHSPSVLDRPLQSCTLTDSSHGNSHQLPAIANTSSGISGSKINPKTLILMRCTAAGGYAAALANIGQSNNILDEIHSDLQKLGSFLQHKQLHSFLSNPSIIDSHKKGILKRVAEDFEFVPYTLSLLNLIIDRKRVEILKDVVMEFESLYKQITEMEVSIILSAVEISADQLGRIARKIQNVPGGKNARMKRVPDSSLIAGFIVKYGKEMGTAIA